MVSPAIITIASSVALLLLFSFLSSGVIASPHLHKHIIRFKSQDARRVYLSHLEQNYPVHGHSEQVSVELLDDIFIGAIISHPHNVAFEEEDRRLARLHALSADPTTDVDLIEQFERDQVIQLADHIHEPSIFSNSTPSKETRKTQEDAPWHLDRLSQDSLPLSGTYDYISHNHGSPVNIYVVDTGVRISHKDFEGRARAAFSAQDGLEAGEDCVGHGTFCAALAAGVVSGVSKRALIHDVRVMDCFGSGANSDVVKGLNWIAKNAVKPAVVNMSFGGHVSEIIDEAVRQLFAKGILPIVAAGNSAVDACSCSPARVEDALTVGASTREDTRSKFSNTGTCVDIYAPGTDIQSASHLSDSDFALMSGTSMSTGVVSGLAAVFLSQYVDLPPSNLKKKILQYALDGVAEEIRPLSQVPSQDVCPSGYGGLNCSVPLCGSKLSTQADVCNGHGECVGPRECSCQEGYSGAVCEKYQCFGIDHDDAKVCGGKGMCSSHDTCECNNGWSGESCEKEPPVTCFQRASTDPLACSGNGECVSTDQCKCKVGYSGEDCSEYQCFGKSTFSTRVCSGQGKCVSPNQCECSDGFFGYECDESYEDTATSLVAIISANSAAMESYHVISPTTSDVKLSGSQSYDPLEIHLSIDSEKEEEKMTYEWSCRELSSDSRLNNRCIDIRSNTATLEIPTTQLHNLRGGSYEITLLISKGDRRQYTSRLLEVASDDDKQSCKTH